jgi:hypothetical protein
LSRPTGSRNKRSIALWDELEGDLDPVKCLSSVVTNPNKPDEIRISAAVALAPYKHSKLGLPPQPPPLVCTTMPALPHPACSGIRHAIENIEFLSALRRDGKLDAASADAAISDMRLIRDGLIEELKTLIAKAARVTNALKLLADCHHCREPIST